MFNVEDPVRILYFPYPYTIPEPSSVNFYLLVKYIFIDHDRSKCDVNIYATDP